MEHAVPCHICSQELLKEEVSKHMAVLLPVILRHDMTLRLVPPGTRGREGGGR